MANGEGGKGRALEVREDELRLFNCKAVAEVEMTRR